MVRRVTLASMPVLAWLLAHGATAWTQSAPDPDSAGPPECALTAVLRGLHPTDEAVQLARVAELAGQARVESRSILRASRNGKTEICMEQGTFPWADRLLTPETDEYPTFDILPATWSTHANTAYPRGRNLGAVWAGKGVSTELRGGVTGRWGPVSAGFAPRVIYSQNKDFPMVGRGTIEGYSPFAHGWHTIRIDWPQRFGADPFWTVDPGQSFVRVDAYGVGVGASTENLWWGPGIRNAIVMSNTAPGIPHVFLGTDRPRDIWVGRLEAEAIWGRLARSEYLVLAMDDEEVLFSGLALSLEPRWLARAGGASTRRRPLPLRAAAQYLHQRPLSTQCGHC
jgi:hypothetical protein